MTKNSWVNYKEIKSTITIKMVLKHYGVFDSLKESGKNFVGPCPIHKGSNTRQFSVNLQRNIWQCFGDCKNGGNVLDFVARMENVSVHQAGLLLKNWFLAQTKAQTSSPTQEAKSERASAKKGNQLVRKGNEKENQPLPFSLKNLDPNHKFFIEKNILENTVDHFGLGFCSKGMLQNWIAIPIYDENNVLIAYCGRAVNQSQSKVEGKYKLPSNFAKSKVVYNLNRQPPDEKTLILVESYLSVWRLFQAGFPNAVALMGSSLSEAQEKLIVEYFSGRKGGVVLLFDADDNGKQCTKDCLFRLGYKLFVRAIDISSIARKPHQISDQKLKSLLL